MFTAREELAFRDINLQAFKGQTEKQQHTSLRGHTGCYRNPGKEHGVLIAKTIKIFPVEEIPNA